VKNWKIWVGFLVTILVASAGIYVAYRWWLADPVSAVTHGEIATVQRGPLVVTVKAVGSVVVPANNTLAFCTSGRIKEVLVAEGDVVEAGELLARLDTTDLELQYRQAQAALALSQATLELTQVGPTEADIKAAAGSLAAAEAVYERVKAGPLAAEVAAAEGELVSAQVSLEDLERGASWRETHLARLAIDQAKNTLWGAQGSRDAIKGSRTASDAQKDQAEAAVLNAEVGVKIAEIQYAQLLEPPRPSVVSSAEARIAQARAHLEKLEAASSSDQLKLAAVQVARARAELARLENSPTPEELAIALARVDQVKISLEQAKRQIDYAVLVAPSGGTVVAVQAEVGQSVSPATPVIVLADLSRLQVEVHVHETHIGAIRDGQLTQIRLDAFPDTQPVGRVSEISPLAAGTGGTVSYLVTIGLPPSDLPIRPGMAARVEIITYRNNDALILNRGALRLEEGRWTVQVLRDGRFEEVEVKIGAKQHRSVEILAGLVQGDQVLLNTLSINEGWPDNLSSLPAVGNGSN